MMPTNTKPAVVNTTPFYFSHYSGDRQEFHFSRRVNCQRIGRTVAVQQAAASVELLAVCEKLAGCGAVIATTGLGNELADAIAKAKGGVA